jgi:sugar lactone lactonase YvrE
MKSIRQRRLTAVGAGIVSLALALAGCGAPAHHDRPATASPNGNITRVVPAAQTLRSPLDAAPSPDGSVIYFTALGEDTSSLWRVSFTGGEPEELATGFTAPVGVVVSSDGNTIYVADAAREEADTDMLGAVLSVPATGGAATVLDGTQGFAPKGLEVQGETVLFTGTDPADLSGKTRGLFAVEGGAVRTVASGAPFSDPVGIAAQSDGTIWVTDTSASFNESGAIIRVVDGAAEIAVDRLHLGSPAGIVLVQDESALLVSGLDVLGAGTAQVYRVELDGLEVLTANAGISQNDEAGGLHRARDKDMYAWAGTTTVYALE